MQLNWQLTCALLAVVNAASTITADDVPRKMQSTDNLKAPQRLPPPKLQQSMSVATTSNIPLPRGFNPRKARISSKLPKSMPRLKLNPYIDVKQFVGRPLPTYRTIANYPHLIPVGKSLKPIGDPAKIADAFIHNYLKVMEYSPRSSYVTKHGIRHAYYKQHVKGIEIANGDIAVHINKSKQIIAYSETAYKRAHAQSRPWPQLPIDQMMTSQKTALAVFYKYINKPITPMALNIVKAQQKDGNAEMFIIKNVPLAVSDVNSKQVYIHDERGILVPAWEFIINMGINNFKVHVSIYGQKLLSVIDWASAASYNAVPVGVANVQVEGLKTLVNPHLSNASRDGWHTIKKVRSEATDGNNAMVAIVDDEVRRLPAIMPTSITNEYDLPFDPDKSPRENGGAAVTNAFYVTNMAHDIFHRYGFVEYAGNFQMDNFDEGGLGNDSVQVVVQNEEVGKNAFFITHADGKHGIMALGLLKEGDKQYDTAFDNDVLMHELTHGLSKRLVGGPANPDCLSTHESKSMGEGWSDFVAMWVRMKETDDDHTQFKLGTYVKPGGIRKLPYALSKEANEATYSFFNKWGWGDIHDTGIIWGNILYQMQRNIHNTMKRFSNDIRTASLEASNTYTMQLIVSAMQLSPCNPTFIQGREALIMADQTLTDGKYRCEIYAAFAKRGVGIEARREGFFDSIVDDFTIPKACMGYSHLLHDAVAF